MLTGDQRTPLDLPFRLFNIPVRVSPWFWLLAALLGQYWLRIDVVLFLAWVGCVFVSILVHEFGHALTARALGSVRVSVLLHGFGGLAFHDPLRERWRRVCVILAGPGAGFVLAAAVYAVGQTLPPAAWRSDMVKMVYGSLLQINIFWGLFNLLPVYPLDGGQFTMEVFSWVSPRYGRIAAAGLSLVIAGGLVATTLLSYLGRIPPYVELQVGPYDFDVPLNFGVFGVIMFGLLAYDSYTRLQAEMAIRRHWDDNRLPWERGDDDRY